MLDAPVTVTTAHQVAPGRAAEFQAWADSMLQEAGKSRHYLGGGVISPGDGSREWHVVYRWSDQDAALRWEGTASGGAPAPAGVPVRSADRVARAARFLESAGTRRADATPAWAGTPAQVRSPPKWKLALVTLAAVFPPVMLFDVTVIPHLRGVPVVVRTTALSVAVTAVVTWVMMPSLQRLLKGWLNPAAPEAQPAYPQPAAYAQPAVYAQPTAHVQPAQAQQTYRQQAYARRIEAQRAQARQVYAERPQQRQGSPVSRRLPVSGSAPAPETGETPGAAGSSGRHRR